MFRWKDLRVEIFNLLLFSLPILGRMMNDRKNTWGKCWDFGKPLAAVGGMMEIVSVRSRSALN